jgi:hypothetical protein
MYRLRCRWEKEVSNHGERLEEGWGGGRGAIVTREDLDYCMIFVYRCKGCVP